jgi:hypothetical protein
LDRKEALSLTLVILVAKEILVMKLSAMVRPWYGLLAFVGLTMVGCGSSNPEGNLPPQVPATEAQIQEGQDEIKRNMGGMKSPGV